MKAPAPVHPTPLFFRRVWPITLLGLLGVLSLLMAPVPEDLLNSAPELASLPPLVQRGVLLINPGLLVFVAAIAGGLVAHRVGLVSVVAGTAPAVQRAGVSARAAASGFALGLSIAAIDTLIAPILGPEWESIANKVSVDASATLIGMFYGGIAEEVMLRWGLMSVVAWVLVSLLRPLDGTFCICMAIALAALIFAAGHLPFVASYLELTPEIVARTLILNSLAGLLYGYVFWRYDLETAMVTHASTHLGFAGWRLVTA